MADAVELPADAPAALRRLVRTGCVPLRVVGGLVLLRWYPNQSQHHYLVARIRPTFVKLATYSADADPTWVNEFTEVGDYARAGLLWALMEYQPE